MNCSKDIKYQKIIEVCFILIAEYGADRITISQVSKKSNISRGWIYKYIGNNIEEVLRFSLNEYAKDFSNESSIKVYEDENELFSYISEYSLMMIDKIKKKPSILKLYFSEHDSDNLIGVIIREVEDRSISTLCSSIQKCFNLDEGTSRSRAEKIIFMRMGALMLYFSKSKFSNDLNWEDRFLNELQNDLKTLLFSNLELKKH
jgi:AcrR family transcriptional regulator